MKTLSIAKALFLWLAFLLKTFLQLPLSFSLIFFVIVVWHTYLRYFSVCALVFEKKFFSYHTFQYLLIFIAYYFIEKSNPSQIYYVVWVKYTKVTNFLTTFFWVTKHYSCMVCLLVFAGSLGNLITWWKLIHPNSLACICF